MRPDWRMLVAGLVLVLAVGAVSAPMELTAQENCYGPSSKYRLYVSVRDLRSPDGIVAATVYGDDSSRFLRANGSLYVARTETRRPETRFCLHIPEPGRYVVAIYHDENANRKFDRGGLLGLPQEGYGFTNNPGTLFGLPRFSSVQITVTEDEQRETIRMKYP